MIKKFRIIIVGGAGFVGLNIAKFFLKKNYNVTIIDKKKIHLNFKNLQYINCDIESIEKIERVIEKDDIIFYFADIADINEAKLKPMLTIRQNILNLSTFLDSIKHKKIKRFIYGSSLYVYSSCGSIYRATKQSAEILIETFSDLYNLNFTFVRFGSLYGKGSQSWNGMNKFISQVINKGYIEYSGNGKEVREYINIEDAARMSAEIAMDKKFNNKAVCLSAQQSITIDQLFTLIFEIFGKKKKIKYLNKKNLDDHYGFTPYRYHPKPSTKIISNSMKDLGEGILETISEIKKN